MYTLHYIMQPICLPCIHVSPSVIQHGDRTDVLHSKHNVSHTVVSVWSWPRTELPCLHARGPNKTGSFKIITIMQIWAIQVAKCGSWRSRDGLLFPSDWNGCGRACDFWVEFGLSTDENILCERSSLFQGQDKSQPVLPASYPPFCTGNCPGL